MDMDMVPSVRSNLGRNWSDSDLIRLGRTPGHRAFISSSLSIIIITVTIIFLAASSSAHEHLLDPSLTLTSVPPSANLNSTSSPSNTSSSSRSRWTEESGQGKENGDLVEMVEGVSRAFFWVTPYFNMNLFVTFLPFALIPIAFIWILLVYPQGKYYSHIPPPPQYVGYMKNPIVDSDTDFALLVGS